MIQSIFLNSGLLEALGALGVFEEPKKGAGPP